MPVSRPVKRRLAMPLLACVAVPLLAVWCCPAGIPAEDDAPARVHEPSTVPQQLKFPQLQIRRDPFMPSRDTQGGPDGVVAEDAGIVLPPNLAAVDQVPAALSAKAPALRAVILGATPKALIDVGGRSMLVGLGSPLLGSSVAAIRTDGIVLQDGERLRFAGMLP